MLNTDNFDANLNGNVASIYNLPIRTMNDELKTLAPYKGKVILIVNVASRCGFTKQYASLEKLYQEYKDKGLAILGFPCNQFLNQEPKDNASIKAFAESCYAVTFPLFAKIDVKGQNQAPIYNYIQNNIQKKPLKFIPWNFSKILVDPQGKVLKQYLPITSFNKIQREVEALLPLVEK